MSFREGSNGGTPPAWGPSFFLVPALYGDRYTGPNPKIFHLAGTLRLGTRWTTPSPENTRSHV